MARLPLRRRRTKLDTVKDLAQIYTTLKLSQAGGKAAKKAAKGYAGVKAAKGGRKLFGPALAALGIAGLVAFLKKRNREPTGYEQAPASSPGATPAAPPSETGTQASSPAPPPTDAAPASEPEAPTGPSAGTTPQPSGGGISQESETTNPSAGSIHGRESYPLGSSVGAEQDTPAGSAGAPKSATTEAGRTES